MAECAQCGRVLTDLHVFCPECGAAVNKETGDGARAAAKAASSHSNCPTCGAGLPAGARFCGECGAAMAPGDAAVSPTAAASLPPVTPAATPFGRTYTGYSAPTWQQPTSPAPGHSYPPGASYGPYGPAYQAPPSNFGEYLAFRKTLTPVVGQITFWLFEGINLFYWIRFIYYDRWSASGIIFGLFALLISALVIRVFMEAAIAVAGPKHQV